MFAKITIIFITIYQKTVSPLTPPACRFTPTCSEYAIQSINKHGFFIGFFWSCIRILKCNPLFKGGYDPVK